MRLRYAEKPWDCRKNSLIPATLCLKHLFEIHSTV